MAYRLLLLGGPCDGDSLVVANPWFRCEVRGSLYLADLDDDGQPVMSEGDDGDSEVICVTADGDSFPPPVKTIRLKYTPLSR